MRRVIGLGLMGLFAAMLSMGPACALFGQQDAASVENVGGQIAVCQSLELSCLADAGKDAGAECYGLYDACMKDAGLR